MAKKLTEYLAWVDKTWPTAALAEQIRKTECGQDALITLEAWAGSNPLKVAKLAEAQEIEATLVDLDNQFMAVGKEANRMAMPTWEYLQVFGSGVSRTLDITTAEEKMAFQMMQKAFGL